MAAVTPVYDRRPRSVRDFAAHRAALQPVRALSFVALKGMLAAGTARFFCRGVFNERPAPAWGFYAAKARGTQIVPRLPGFSTTQARGTQIVPRLPRLWIVLRLRLDHAQIPVVPAIDDVHPLGVGITKHYDAALRSVQRVNSLIDA